MIKEREVRGRKRLSFKEIHDLAREL